MGEEISSYSNNLAFALTNPTHTSPNGYDWNRFWTEGQEQWRNYLDKGIEYNGTIYKDVEQAFQLNRVNCKNQSERNQLMISLIENKLKTYPKLIQGIKYKGSINYLKTSTHQPTNKGSYWETSGKNGFINCLTQAYTNIITTKTTVVNQSKENFDVFIGRPSKWGNKFTHKKNTTAEFVVSSREEAVSKYKEWIMNGEGQYLLKYLHELVGKKLGCYCKPQLCHGDILAELTNNMYYEEIV